MQIAHVELLQGMPLFGGLEAAALRRLLDRARPVARAAGDAFFLEGEAADAMYVLESGRVAVTRRWGREELMLHALGAGDCFGEMALIDLQPRSASVRAIEDCRAIAFGTDDMLSLYETDVAQFALMQMNLARELCRRLRATDDLLFKAAMGQRPAPPASFGPAPGA